MSGTPRGSRTGFELTRGGTLEHRSRIDADVEARDVAGVIGGEERDKVAHVADR